MNLCLYETGKFVNELIFLSQTIGTSLGLEEFARSGLWPYLLLVLLVAVEGPVATLLGAAAASAGFMRPLPVFLAAAVGNLTADTLWYTIGYLGRIYWLFHFGRRLGISQDMLQKLEAGMLKNTAKFLFLAKLSVSLVIPSLIAAGLVKAPWRRWFPAVFAAEIFWTGSLLVTGFYTTEAVKQLERMIEYFALIGIILFIILFLRWGLRWLKKYQPEHLRSKSW